ncbi:phosphoribosylanthranilate isomerase [Bartonella sp. DGB2]|uniref:phosphoribosylanthranilate isomerase n=1 Tax=Bartonella sp. DGB2 TaxID=3388426 RepID=UPI00398FE212
MRIKICGITEQTTLKAAINLGAQAIGFVFFEKSPRHLSLDQARYLRSFVPPSCQLVAVCVNADDTFLNTLFSLVQPDSLQLHGEESPARAQEIKKRYNCEVIKAVPIETSADIIKTHAYETVADWLLLDAKPSKDATLPGGNGKVFDWQILNGVHFKKPLMLSGGLSANNVATACKIVTPQGLDVSSSLEIVPGIKDISRLIAFFAALNEIQPKIAQPYLTHNPNP